jgi:hypothetical protein
MLHEADAVPGCRCIAKSIRLTRAGRKFHVRSELSGQLSFVSQRGGTERPRTGHGLCRHSQRSRPDVRPVRLAESILTADLVGTGTAGLHRCRWRYAGTAGADKESRYNHHSCVAVERCTASRNRHHARRQRPDARPDTGGVHHTDIDNDNDVGRHIDTRTDCDNSAAGHTGSDGDDAAGADHSGSRSHAIARHADAVDRHGTIPNAKKRIGTRITYYYVTGACAIYTGLHTAAACSGRAWKDGMPFRPAGRTVRIAGMNNSLPTA